MQIQKSPLRFFAFYTIIMFCLVGFSQSSFGAIPLERIKQLIQREEISAVFHKYVKYGELPVYGSLNENERLEVLSLIKTSKLSPNKMRDFFTLVLRWSPSSPYGIYAKRTLEKYLNVNSLEITKSLNEIMPPILKPVSKWKHANPPSELQFRFLKFFFYLDQDIQDMAVNMVNPQETDEKEHSEELAQRITSLPDSFFPQSKKYSEALEALLHLPLKQRISAYKLIYKTPDISQQAATCSFDSQEIPSQILMTLTLMHPDLRVQALSSVTLGLGGLGRYILSTALGLNSVSSEASLFGAFRETAGNLQWSPWTLEVQKYPADTIDRYNELLKENNPLVLQVLMSALKNIPFNEQTVLTAAQNLKAGDRSQRDVLLRGFLEVHGPYLYSFLGNSNEEVRHATSTLLTSLAPMAQDRINKTKGDLKGESCVSTLEQMNIIIQRLRSNPESEN